MGGTRRCLFRSQPRLPQEGRLRVLLPIFCCKRPRVKLDLPAQEPAVPGRTCPPGCRGDCFGWQLQNSLWVTHTFHGRLRSTCLFKGKLGVRRRWVWAASWLSQAWTLRLGRPVGSPRGARPRTDQGAAGRCPGARLPACVLAEVCQELSPTLSPPCAALWGVGRVWGVWAGSGPHEGGWGKPTGGAPARPH